MPTSSPVRGVTWLAAFALVGASVLVTLAIVEFQSARPERTDAARNEQLQRKLDELSQQVNALNVERAAVRALALRDDTSALPAAAPLTGLASSLEPESSPSDEADREGAQRAAAEGAVDDPDGRRAEQFALLDQVITSERRDGEWARGVEESFEQLASTPAFETMTVTKATCAATLCKVEVASKDAGQPVRVQTLVESFPRDALGGMSLKRTGNPEGSEVVAFFVRQGHPMPRVD